MGSNSLRRPRATLQASGKSLAWVEAVADRWEILRHPASLNPHPSPIHHEEPSLSPPGDAGWTADQGCTQESKTPLPWTFDEEGNMLLVAGAVPALSPGAREILDEDVTPPPAPAPDLLRLFQRTVAIAKS